MPQARAQLKISLWTQQTTATCTSGGHIMSNSGQSGWNLVKVASGWYLELSG